MDVQKGLLGMETLIGRTVAQTLIDSEVPLPDGREATAVLAAKAHILVEETACMAGVVRVLGRLELTVLCQTAESEPFGFTAASTFTHRIELEGVQDGMSASCNAQALECHCEFLGKALHFHAIVELSALVAAGNAVPYVANVTGGAGLELRREQIPVRRRVPLGEHTLRIREEISLPDCSLVLLASGEAIVTNIAFAGATANVEGRLYLTLLVRREDGQLVSQREAVAFTDVIEAKAAPCAYGRARVLSLSAVAAGGGFSTVDAEAVIRITLLGVVSEETTVLADAYDTNASFTCERAQTTALLLTGEAHRTLAVRESLLVPKHLPEAYRPLYAAATAVVTGVSEADGRLTVDAMLLVTAIYRCDGGFLHSFTEDIPVTLPLDTPFCPDADVRLAVLFAELRGSARALELNCEIQASAELYATEPVQVVSEIVAGGTACPHRGVLIHCAGVGETVWDVGKRFSVPLSQLGVWNPGLADPIPEGQPIVLVR